MVEEAILVMLVSASPLSELRGGIPLGISLGLPPLWVFLLAVAANILVFFPVFFALELSHKVLLARIPFFPSYIQRVRNRGRPLVRKHGFLGLALFVAVPLPLTGVYSGTVLSWLMGMDLKKSSLAIGLGALMAGIVVFSLTMGAKTGLEYLFPD
ncbi:MAG TPA: small multi-drug export protein [Dehalococcoidia bacterium]|nr:small multi-drug export protein [Dehalococcoidia bacterium]